MKKTIFQVMVEEEYERSKKMLQLYQKELDNYPKGSIQVKNINGKDYYYLTFRENKKVETKYIGNSRQGIAGLEDKLEIRKKKEVVIKQLKKEIKEIEYMLSYKEWNK